MESEAQRKANRKWKSKHRLKQKYYSYKSFTKTFIKSLAKPTGLKVIQDLLNQRLNKLK